MQREKTEMDGSKGHNINIKADTLLQGATTISKQLAQNTFLTTETS
jgi:membrane peptidoglycan carboxypeptidase